MFTGIITKKSKILGTTDRLGTRKVLIENNLGDNVKLGASISINGVCSTVVESNPESFAVEYMNETLKKTTMQYVVAEDFVNLEESLRAGDSIDGHFVYGHIDCVGVIEKVKLDGESKVISVSIPKEFHKYLAYKGSVTVEGVSLTISEITKNGCEVSLIPYTLRHTTLGDKKPGNVLNIETDIMARYVERLISSKK